MPEAYTERTYRKCVRSHLQSSRVTVQETDLNIYTPETADQAAKEAVIEHRGYLEAYIRSHPYFIRALDPLPTDPLAPGIVREMILAGQKAQVGPMAAVAGAMAEQVGRALLHRFDEVIVENGGDIFLRTDQPLTVGIFAGSSPLSMRVGIQIDPDGGCMGVCTSSGTVGHSLSMGRADAVCVISDRCALADAAATAIGNRVEQPGDIQRGIEWGRGIDGVDGVVVIVGDQIGGWGKVELVSLQ